MKSVVIVNCSRMSIVRQVKGADRSVTGRSAHSLSLCAILVFVLLALGGTTARAADYCVGSVVQQSGCGGGSYSATATGLQDALDEAAATGESDKVFIGAHTITGEFIYNDPDPVEVAGAGKGKTVLQPPSQNGADAFTLEQSSGSKVRDMSCQMQTTEAASCFVVGKGSIENVSVTGSTIGGSGVFLIDAKATGLDLNLGDIWPGDGITISTMGGSSTVTDTSITVVDGSGIESYAENVTLSRVRISSLEYWGIGIYDSNVFPQGQGMVVKDSLIEINGDNSIGIHLGNYSGGDVASLDVVRTTFVNTRPGYNKGIHTEAIEDNPGSPGSTSTDISVQGSIIDGFSTALECDESAGDSGVLVVDTTAYNGSIKDDCGGGIDVSHPTNKLVANSGFVDPVGGDYRLAWNSPLIDVGSLPGPCFLNCLQDLDGLSRFKNGNGQGGSEADLGAFEYQRRSPTTTASASPVTVKPGESVSYTGSGNDLDAGDQLSYSWSFDDGVQKTGQNVSHSFQTPGIHTATLTVTDPTGLTAQASTDVTVQQVEDSGSKDSPGPGPGPGPGLGSKGDLAPKSKFVRLARVARVNRLKALRGTATDDQGVLRVDLALVVKRGKRCFALKANGKLQRYKPTKKLCKPRFLIRAKGTKSWSLKPGKALKRALTKLARKKVKIEFYSRATDSNGQRETNFTAKQGNRRKLRLR